MRKLVVIGVSVSALLGGASITSVVRSQSAPKTCSEAHSACTAQHHLTKECEEEKQWCLKTGTFADPKTKATSSGLQKK